MNDGAGQPMIPLLEPQGVGEEGAGALPRDGAVPLAAPGHKLLKRLLVAHRHPLAQLSTPNTRVRRLMGHKKQKRRKGARRTSFW